MIGAAHAGWRGALAGVLEATVAAMERLGAERSRIRAALGPMIRQHNYEVGPDLIARFAAEDSASERFFVPASRSGHALFDLAAYIAARLQRAGIRQIEDVGLCTYADPARFFSFRRSTHRAEAGLRPSRQRHRSDQRIARGKQVRLTLSYPPLAFAIRCRHLPNRKAIAIAAENRRGQGPDSCCQPPKRLVSGPCFC